MTAVGVVMATTSGVVLSSAVNAQSAASIIVQGNRRIEADTIRSYFSGGELSAARVDEGIKAMYATGLFRDVRVSRQGGRLVVQVSENEVINRVVFEGNRRLKTDQLMGEIESKARGTFSRAMVQSDTQRLYDLYRRTGRYEVEITPKTIEQPNGRIDLVFEITEGKKASVRAINFVGNNAFGRQRLLDVMSTAESGIFSWLKSNDVYDADRLNADQEAIRRLYLRSGYVDMRVLSARADFDQAANAFTISIEIEEGPQYRIGSVDVQSNIRDVDGATLRGAVKTQPGAVYNVELVDKSLEDVTLEVARRGYAFAAVRPRGERDPSTLTVNLVYVVEEGPRVYVERINVRGNTRTQDRVIRREFDMAEGDAYNRVLVDRAERRLKNLGFFKDVRITTEPGSAADRVIVNVEIQDQPTGAFSIAGGYSTSDGFIAEASVEERNFLGRGQFVRLGGTFGQRSRGVNFSFTEPFLLDYRLAGGFDIFYRQTNRSSWQPFQSTSYGATLRLGIPITENLAVQLRYSGVSQRISIRDDQVNCYTGYNGQLSRFNNNGNVSYYEATDPRAVGTNEGLAYVQADGTVGTGVTANPYSCLSDGETSVALRAINNRTRFISMLGYSLIYSNLDRATNPSQGLYAELRQDFAGAGGNARFIRTTFESRYYQDLSNDWIGMLRLQAGHIGALGGRLDSVDQFFMGPELVRGFQTAGIGPRDFAIANASGILGRLPDAVGGTMYWGASAEVTFPISILPRDFGMRGALFADAGSVWGYNSIRSFNTGGGVLPVTLDGSDAHKIRSAVGVGLLWNSPFGPIRFDYSFVLSKARGDQTQAFRFSGGTRF
ncbi:outer membrane protein assembly factor BamA [Phreatobacter sp.]|uniref:outer membrane protein assembly factor BamA n=1 Tax=Phreatobacter sp. TaxID=1966341 RepID=UPI0022BE8F59|nr:outer membrane protein assembly factor BamA [Phreatobacter sp.]MCZ8316340.1 outer membrane protein assembly factor BamA [Phreatobacter sp.]